MTTLTERQRRFVEAYAGSGMHCNVTKAARIAGYVWPGKQGPRLLRFPAVGAEIDYRLAAYVAELRAAGKAEIHAAWCAFRPDHALSWTGSSR